MKMMMESYPRRRRSLLLFSVCALGISCIMTQLTLMRELLTIFSGNEMVFGVILGNWLLLMGVGSHLGRTASRLKDPLTLLVVAEILVAIFPIAQVFLGRTLRDVVFMRGRVVGVTETVVSCLVLLMPYCLTAGYVLTLACCVLASREGALSIGQVYFMDSIGSIVGGLLFSFVLIYFFGHFSILYFPAFLNLAFACGVALLLERRALVGAAAAAAAALAGLIVFLDLDEVSTKIQYSGERVLFHGNSPYGNLVVTESHAQLNFIESGVPLFSTENVEEVEETVHYAMAQRTDAENVLLISGGVSGTAKEILKYGVRRVDYVELDPLIIEVGRKYAGENLADERIKVINADGRFFVKETRNRYDVAITDLPDPSTSQINRFYTYQFFKEIKRVLRNGGVLSFSLGEYQNYLSRELARLISVAHRTLKEAFENVLVFPAAGGGVFFLASDGALYSDIATRMEEKRIETQLLRRPYLSTTLTPDRLADVRRAFSEKAPLNRDFSPVLYYYHLLRWMSQFKVRFGILEGVLLAIFAIYLFRIRAVPFAIFTTGFAASALEVIILVAFQILHGYVYHNIGLMVTTFMLGLAIGSFAMNRMLPLRSRRDLVKLEFGIALYAGLLPFLLMALGFVGGGVESFFSAEVAFPLLTLILGALVGMEFPLAAKADFRGVASTAGRLYTADFVGACLGAMAVSTLLIPVMGVMAVCLLAAGLNIVSGFVVLLTGKS